MPIVTDEMLEASFSYFRDQAEAAAQAKADLILAEYRRKKTLSRLILESSEKSLGMKEAEALCHPDTEEAYIVEAQCNKVVEWHRHQKARAEAIVQAWQTQESTRRSMGKFV